MRKILSILGRDVENAFLALFAAVALSLVCVGCTLGPKNPVGAASISILLLMFVSGVGVVLLGEAIERVAAYTVIRIPAFKLWWLRFQIALARRELLGSYEHEIRICKKANEKGIRLLRRTRRMIRYFSYEA